MPRNTFNGKWKPLARDIILNYLKKYPKDFIAEPQIRLKTALGMKTCNSTLHILTDNKSLIRKQCPCGRGWMYKYK